MPRRPRLQDAGFIHHVFSRGNNREKIFNFQEDFQRMIEFIIEARKKHDVYLYNYVLMDNHLHFLIEPKSYGSLTQFMEYVLKNYAKYFNYQNDRVGHVFQGRYKDLIIQTETYFFRCLCYIDYNPVKSGLVKNAAEYTFSGHNSLAWGKESQIKLDCHDIYKKLGFTDKEQQQVYREILPSFRYDNLSIEKKRSSVLGDKDFKDKINKKIKR
ncbi:MAG: transposase [Candidatus Zapsychrus exili]|nr:transposase [Candidatus Zapsychrus exili]